MKHLRCCRCGRPLLWVQKAGNAHRGPCTEKATAATAAAGALLMCHSAAVPAASRGRRRSPQERAGDSGGGVSSRGGGGGGRGVGGRGGGRRHKKQPPRLQRHSAAVPAASRGSHPSPQSRVGNSGGGVSGRGGGGGGRGVGGRGGGRPHPHRATAAPAAPLAPRPDASRGRRHSPKARVGDSGGGVSGRGGGRGGRGVGGRGGGRRHTEQPSRLLGLWRPALTPRLHHIGGERQRAGRACSRRSLGGVRRRGAEERHAARRKPITLQRGGTHRARAWGSAGSHRALPHASRPARVPRGRYARTSRARGGARVYLVWRMRLGSEKSAGCAGGHRQTLRGRSFSCCGKQ